MISGSRSQDLIGPDPEEAAVLLGTTVTLTCSRAPGGEAGMISWNEEIPGGGAILIYFGTTKGSTVPKYDNFELTSDGGVDQFDLVINNIAIEDEGRYYCQHVTTGEIKYGIRTVESKLYFSFWPNCILFIAHADYNRLKWVIQ